MSLLHDVILNCSGEAMSISFTLMRRYGDTDFVTGLRAVAIVMVLVIHSGAFVDFGTIGQSVTDNGKFGVQIFFVIAGFTIFLGAMAPWICGLCVVLWLWLMMNYRPDNGGMFALVTAAMIVCVHPSNWVARILTTRPMIIIGSVSYSIYLIHMTIIYIMDAASVNDHISRLSQFGIVILVTLALSILSYRYVEVPFNRFGKRFVLKYFK